MVNQVLRLKKSTTPPVQGPCSLCNDRSDVIIYFPISQLMETVPKDKSEEDKVEEVSEMDENPENAENVEDSTKDNNNPNEEKTCKY